MKKMTETTDVTKMQADILQVFQKRLEDDDRYRLKPILIQFEMENPIQRNAEQRLVELKAKIQVTYNILAGLGPLLDKADVTAVLKKQNGLKDTIDNLLTRIRGRDAGSV